MLAFYLILSLIIVCSFLVGVIISKELKLNEMNHNFITPIGFVVLLGILQVFYYPVQILGLKSNFILYITIAILIFVVVISTLFYRKHIAIIFRNYKLNKSFLIFGILFFFISTFIMFHLNLQIRFNDGQFYFDFIRDKIAADYYITNSNLLYQYQGYYDFVAVILKMYYKLVQFGFGNYYVSFGIVTTVMGTLFCWFLSFTIVDLACWIKVSMKQKNISTWVVFGTSFMILVYYITSDWFGEWFYTGNAFRKISVAILLYLLIEFVKKFNWKILFAAMLVTISLISQTSTGFFFSAFMFYCLLIYFAYSNASNYLTKFGVLCLGPAIYLVLFMPKTLFLVLFLYFLLVLLIICKKVGVIEKFFNKFYVYVLFGLPLLFGLISRLPSYNPFIYTLLSGGVHPFSFGYGVEDELIDDLLYFNLSSPSQFIWTLFSIFVWGCITYFVVQKLKVKNVNEKFLPIYILVCLLTFFNPWVANFVAKYFTGIVYFRIYDLFFNLTTVFIILLFVMSKLPKKSSVVFIVICFVLFNFHNDKLRIKSTLRLNDPSYSHIYHNSKIDIEIIDKLYKEYIVNEEKPVNVAQQIYMPNILTDYPINFIVDSIYRFNGNDSDEDEFQRIFYRNGPGIDELSADYMQACLLSRDRDVKYFIIDAQFNSELENALGYCAELLFEVENYRVFVARYNWMAQYDFE
ncbi:MAG: hypothetical protein RR945_01610 [Erysipelotrichaceae bacterium]